MKEWLKSLFPHDKPVRYVLTLFVLLLLGAMATTCRADEPYLKFEVGAQALRGNSAVVGLQAVAPKVIQDADVECGLLLVGGRLDNLGDPKNGVMGVSCMIVDGYGKFDLGLGVIHLNHTDDLNGSQLNFLLKLGYNFNKKWGVAYRHISNAGTTDTNTGRDLILLTYSFR